jgi:protein SCO1/2
MNSRWKILVPFLVLLFPVIFWLILVRGHNEFKKLPVVAPFEINANGDTVFHKIPDFSLTNQEGKSITQKDLDGKIYVANFFFATCPTVCPKMNEQVQRVQNAFKDVKDFQIVSHTVDPVSDSVPVLMEYAKKMKADHSKWWFLTGDKDSIYDLARKGYLVPAATGEMANDFFHSQDLILIDKEKRMRGIYDGLEPFAVDTLIDEIKVLLKEYE